jgi:hypothetical protein
MTLDYRIGAAATMMDMLIAIAGCQDTAVNDNPAVAVNDMLLLHDQNTYTAAVVLLP